MLEIKKNCHAVLLHFASEIFLLSSVNHVQADETCPVGAAPAKFALRGASADRQPTPGNRGIVPRE